MKKAMVELSYDGLREALGLPHGVKVSLVLNEGEQRRVVIILHGIGVETPPAEMPPVTSLTALLQAERAVSCGSVCGTCFVAEQQQQRYAQLLQRAMQHEQWIFQRYEPPPRSFSSRCRDLISRIVPIGVMVVSWLAFLGLLAFIAWFIWHACAGGGGL